MATTILGINAFHGDSSACLVVDGRVVAAAEEERFLRVKHWAGFPSESIRYCLSAGGIDGSVDHVALNRDPRARLFQKIRSLARYRPSAARIFDRLRNGTRSGGVARLLEREAKVSAGRLHFVEHHRAHLASAFFASPFEKACLISVDGFGDFASAMWGHGDGSSIRTAGEVTFPHSLGILYQAVTQYLGFLDYGDEYKVMGLSAYGSPRFALEMESLVQPGPSGTFTLGLDYFTHHSEGVSMAWDGGQPSVGRLFSSKLPDLLGGPPREPNEPVTERHRDIAASLQRRYEEIFFHLARFARESSGSGNLCLAGGCAMNSVANGRLRSRMPLDHIYVHPAPGDAGGAVGAALHVWSEIANGERPEPILNAYLGPQFDPALIEETLSRSRSALEREGCSVTRMDSDERLCIRAASAIAEGRIVGWFQGRMEWGPRALGNRSILADPRRDSIRETLNSKIKRREEFRPFAPAVLRERVKDWFEVDAYVPFMSEVQTVKADCRAKIPAVTHVDGTARLQTVDKLDNPLFYSLIEEFERQSGTPILLNTSFNENEPIVCDPQEALDCFLRTRLDMLVIGPFCVERI